MMTLPVHRKHLWFAQNGLWAFEAVSVSSLHTFLPYTPLRRAHGAYCVCRSSEEATVPPQMFQCLSPLKQEQCDAAVRIRDVTDTHVSLLVVLVPVCTDWAGAKHHHTSWKGQVF